MMMVYLHADDAVDMINVGHLSTAIDVNILTEHVHFDQPVRI